MKYINILYLFFIVLVLSLLNCEYLKVKVEVSGTATAPPEARGITGRATDTSIGISWQEPALTSTHKQANGQTLTSAEVSYRIYAVAKGDKARTIAEIKGADTSPLETAKGTTNTNIHNLTPNTTYEIVVQVVNATNTTKVSTGKRIEVTTLTTNQATAPAEVSNIVAGSVTASSTTLSWTAPTLTSEHKKANGQTLTSAEVSYKVYRVAKGAKSRTVTQIKIVDNSPLAVTKGTTRITINNLTANTPYEIVVQSVNATDTTKVSTGIRIEVTTNNSATAPAEARGITGSPTDTSVAVSWQAPALTSIHKKANGQRLTVADVSYKVYRVAKGSNARTIAEIKTADTKPIEVAKGTTYTNIPNLTRSTTYEIVVQSVNATDTTKVSTGIRIEVTAQYKYTPMNRSELITAIKTIIDTDKNGRIDYLSDDLDANLNSIDTSNITDMSSLFTEKTKLDLFDGDISNWNVSNVTDMGSMFNGAEAFNSDLSNWNVSNVTDMSAMFRQAIAFNSDLSNWNVSKVTNMRAMFNEAEAFNSDLSNWNVSNVTNMIAMFYSATAFNSDLSNWNVSNVTNMSFMFYYATAFNSDISKWNVSNVTNMSYMFSVAKAFNSDLSNWNVSKVTNMREMFYYATAFNSDISKWNVSNVTDMSKMFSLATAFNSDLSNWNVSKVTNMREMFYYATAFNSDLSNWNVSNVTDMSKMFYSATAFKRDLEAWGKHIGKKRVFKGDMFYKSGVTTPPSWYKGTK